MTEFVRQRRTDVAPREESKVCPGHDSLAQSQGDIGLPRYLCAQREGGIGLHGHHFLVVEAQSDAQFAALLGVGRENHGGIRLVLQVEAIGGFLVEEVAAYGGGDERGPVVVDAVAFVQPEFCTQEQGVHLGHVLVAHIADAIAFLGALSILQTTAERHGLQSQLLFQFHEFIPLRHGGFLTSANERIDGVLAETCSAVAMNIHQDGDVCHGKVFVELVPAVGIDELQQNAGGAGQFAGRAQRLLYGDAYHVIGSHGLSHIHGEIVLQTAVNKHHVAQADGRECTGNRHTGAHGLAEQASVEHILGVVDHIGGHTSEGNRQPAEVDGVGIGHGEFLEQHADILTANESTARHFLLFVQLNGTRIDIGVLFLTLMETLQTQVVAVGKHYGPVLHPDNRVERMGVFSSGIETAHYAAHARTGDDVDGDACPLNHFQRTDVGHALCTAAAEHHGYLLALEWRSVVSFFNRINNNILSH